jgi:hypothetical protein
MKKVLLVFLCFAALNSFNVRAQNKPIQIANEHKIDLNISTNYSESSNNDGIIYSKTFENKGSAYIKLHVKSFNLRTGEFLKVYSPITYEEFIYSERGKIIGTNKEMISEFWTGTIWSDKIIIELHTTANSNSNYGFKIDRVAYGFTPNEINNAVERLDGNNQNESICSVDNKEPIACYDGTEMGRKAEAVCRLLINGGGLCTGWLLGCDGNVMTNNHCIGSASDANNTDFMFNYKYDNCAGTSIAAQDLQADNATFIQTSDPLDFTLVKLPVNPTATYGYLSLSSTVSSVGERIYIPQHPGGRRKEIAVNTDVGGDANGYAMITGVGGNGARLTYQCDTEGGSSGSPVLRYNDNLVVGIHNTGGCPNGAAGRSDEIIAAIAANMPPCGIDDNNPDAPIISANTSSIQSVNEGTDCSFQDIDVTIRIAQSPTANADVTLSISGGTATNNEDFELLTSNVTFLANQDVDQTATVRVYNDSFVEGDENITISLSLNNNGGDAQLSSNDSFVIDILDDEIDPNIGNNVTLLNDDFETNLNNFNVTGNGTSNFAISNSAGASSGSWPVTGNDTNFIFVNDDDCNCDMSEERIAIASALDLSNYYSANISFDMNHTDSNDQYNSDSYVQVSTDNGANWSNLSNELPSTSGWENFNFDLSAYAGQTDVMVSILYSDMGNWAYGIAIDNFSIVALNEALPQTDVNTISTHKLNNAGTINVLDETTNNILTTITNNDGFIYDCLNVSVSRQGTSGQAFQTYPSPLLAMDKTYSISAANTTNTGDNTISFYFTEAEVAGWETAVANAGGNHTRSDLFIYRDNESVAANITAFGSGWRLTGDFTGVSGTYSFAQSTSILGVDDNAISNFSLYPNPVKDVLNIKANNNQRPDNYAIYSVLGQVIKQNEINNTQDLTISTSALSTGLYFIKLNKGSQTQVIRFVKE